MLKAIADRYQYGSITSESSIYEFRLEDSLEMMPSIEDKLESVPNVIQFYWKMKELLKEAVNVVSELKKEHDSALIKNRFTTGDKLKLLSPIVNPSILRLIEEEDKAGMGKLVGPIYKH